MFLERREITRPPGDGVALVANKQVSSTNEAGCSNYLLALLAKYGDNIELCRADSSDAAPLTELVAATEIAAAQPAIAAIGCNEAHSNIQQLPLVSSCESLRHEFGSDVIELK